MMQHQIDEKQPGNPATGGAPVEEEEHKSGWKHWGMMALCCLPMIAILVLLVLGVWGR